VSVVATKTDRAEALSKMQSGELQWWVEFMDQPTAKHRMLAVYGARYLPFFWETFLTTRGLIEFGCGPMPVASITYATRVALVDTLADEYRSAGLLEGDTKEHMRPALSTGDIGAFDTALVLNVMDHAADDEVDQLMRDAYASLRPKGRLAFYVQLHKGDDHHRPLTMEAVDAGLSRFDVQKALGMPASKMDPEAYAVLAHRPDDRAEALAEVLGVLRGAGITHWIACGTALGAVRDGDFIAWDHDIDLIFDGPIKAVREAFAGYVELIDYERETAYAVQDLRIDFFQLQRAEGSAFMTAYAKDGPVDYVYDPKHFADAQTVEIAGVRAPAPIFVREYLAATYGEDWKTPKIKWSFSKDPPCIR
jgi:SAM-dependent methyltransferase